MCPSADIASELDEGLKQLFDAGLALSLQLQADAMAAEPAERSRLALTFHRLSRGVRQTAALRMRLAREAERAGREASAEVVQLDQRRLEKRKAHVKAAVECLIWTEAESAEVLDAFKEKFEDLLDIETQDAETFEGEPLDQQIARLAWVIGLSVPPPLGVEAGGEPVGLAEGGTSARPTASAEETQPPLLSENLLSPSRTAPPSGEQPGAPWASSA